MSGQRILKKTFTIKNFHNWHHTIYENAIDFFEKYGVYPHILLASEKTFLEIDAIANFTGRDNIRDEVKSANFKNPEPGSLAHLGAFCTEDFEIEFALEEKLEFGKAKLVFDIDPDGGGEEWEDVGELGMSKHQTRDSGLCGSSELGKPLRKVG